jgi:hypothetical protein
LKTQLLEKATENRRELFVFAFLVSVWGVIVGAFAAGLYAFARIWLIDSAWAHPLAALGLGALVFLGLTGLGSYFLARWLGGTDHRSFNLVVPVMAFNDRIEILDVEGYHTTAGIRARFQCLGQAGLMDTYRKNLGKYPGDPFHGELHQKVASAMSDEMVHVVADACEFLLSEGAAYHGFDFRLLADPQGPCSEVTVKGKPGTKIFLPSGCKAETQISAPDAEGNTTSELLLRGRFGEIRFWLSPQWAHLSDRYHHLSFDLLKKRLRPQVKDYSVCLADRTPTLWPVEVHVQMRAELASNPLFLISKRADVYALWIGELLERVERRLSWKIFMERSAELTDKAQM